MKKKTLLFPVEITFLLIRDKNPSWCLVHCKKTESRNDSVLCHVVNRRRQLLVSTWVRCQHCISYFCGLVLFLSLLVLPEGGEGCDISTNSYSAVTLLTCTRVPPANSMPRKGIVNADSNMSQRLLIQVDVFSVLFMKELKNLSNVRAKIR